MENPYSMAKLSLEAKDNLRPKRDCGFYVKYFFLFLSLIQFLIILGLVLFMVYGNAQVGTEQHVQELKANLQQCTVSVKARNQDIAGLKRQLNASQTHANQLQLQLTRTNASYRQCNDDKLKFLEQQRRDSTQIKMCQEERYNCNLLNITCGATTATLQEQIKASELRSELEQKKLTFLLEGSKEKSEKAKQEKEVCETAKKKVETQVQTYGHLEAQVLEEMASVRQKLKATVEQSAIHTSMSCNHYDINSMRQACLGLSGTLQSQFEEGARRLDQRVGEVSQRIAKAESEKALCLRNVEDGREQLGLQREQCEREKEKVREGQEAEVRKKEAEMKGLLSEKLMLQLQLEQSKQACLNTRMHTLSPSNRLPMVPGTSIGSNPLGNFPASFPSTRNLGVSGSAALHPHAFGNPSLPGRTGTLTQPSVGAQGNPSYPERFKLPEIKKSPVETAKLQNQPPSPPVGQPSG
uniref:Plasmalemma vesicle-associated protein n=1 Tax=Salvator merianae TaxID=96440 RepID=A0A8D0E3R4_SALMN